MNRKKQPQPSTVAQLAAAIAAEKANPLRRRHRIGTPIIWFYGIGSRNTLRQFKPIREALAAGKNVRIIAEPIEHVTQRRPYRPAWNRLQAMARPCDDVHRLNGAHWRWNPSRQG